MAAVTSNANFTATVFISKFQRAIAGFHSHTIIKTIQQIKSRIKEIKEDEYSNSLAKPQICAMFRAGDIRRNVLLKLNKALYGDAMFVSL